MARIKSPDFNQFIRLNEDKPKTMGLLNSKIDLHGKNKKTHGIYCKIYYGFL